MSNPLIEGAKKRIAAHGPDRVLVDSRGTAVSAFRAKTEFGTEADVIFIRWDAWTLGAPWKLVTYARSIWKNEWAEEIIINPKPPAPPKPDVPKDSKAAPAPEPGGTPAAQPAPVLEDAPKPAEPVPEPAPDPAQAAPAQSGPGSPKMGKPFRKVERPPDKPPTP